MLSFFIILKGKIKITYVIVVEENKKQPMVLFGNIKNNFYLHFNIYKQDEKEKT
jgi:hypothetical protein